MVTLAKQVNKAVLRAAKAERKLAKCEAKLMKAQAKVEARRAKLEAMKKFYDAALTEAKQLGAYHDDDTPA